MNKFHVSIIVCLMMATLSYAQVGINTNTPQAKLHVEAGSDESNTILLTGSADDGPNISIGNSANNSWKIDAFGAGDSRLRISSEDGTSGNNERISILENGYVGIGVTDPTRSLQVEGAILARSGDPDLLNTNNNGFAFIGDNDSGLFSPQDGELKIRVDSYDFLKMQGSLLDVYASIHSTGNILTDGYVGIGTTNPTKSLHVEGAILARSGFPDANNAFNNGFAFIGDNDSGLFSAADGDLRIVVNNVNVMTMEGSGLTVHGNILARSGFPDFNNAFNNGFAFIGDNDSGLFSAADGDLRIVVNNTNVMTMEVSGLTVDGNIVATTGDIGTNYNIFAGGNIQGGNIQGCVVSTCSDQRIKDIEGYSDNQEDLNTLMDIKVVDYSMKDQDKFKQKFKKVIAQEVREVFPQAITLSTGIIPNIYQDAILGNGRIEVENELEKGDRVKIIFSGKRHEIVEVLNADVHGFNIALEEEGEVFVYGKEVDDFHSVDYDALSMLNISATQELYNRIQALEKENEALRTEVDAVSELKAQLEAITTSLESQGIQVNGTASNK